MRYIEINIDTYLSSLKHLLNCRETIEYLSPTFIFQGRHEIHHLHKDFCVLGQRSVSCGLCLFGIIFNSSKSCFETTTNTHPPGTDIKADAIRPHQPTNNLSLTKLDTPLQTSSFMLICAVRTPRHCSHNIIQIL